MPTGVDTGRSSTAVAGGTVYVGAGGLLFAVDAATGAERWRYDARDQTASAPTLVQSSPAVSAGTVYVGLGVGEEYPGLGGALLALDATTGRLIWRVPTEARLIASPTVEDGVVYAGTENGTIFAVDAATGSNLWHLERTDERSSTPALAGGMLYVGGESLSAIDAATGEQFWQEVGVSHSTPVLAEGLVITGGLGLSAFDAETGIRSWYLGAEAGHFGSPAVAGTTLCAGSYGRHWLDIDRDYDEDGEVAAFDIGTGRESWWTGLDDRVESAVITDGAYVYYGTAGGEVGAIDATSGEKRWHREVGDGHVSAPALAGGVLFVTTENELVALRGGGVGFPIAIIVVLTAILTGLLFVVWMVWPRKSEAPKEPRRRPSPRILEPGPPD